MKSLDLVMQISAERAGIIANLQDCERRLDAACRAHAGTGTVQPEKKPEGPSKPPTATAPEGAQKRRGRKPKGAASEPAIVDSGATSSEPDAESTASDPGGLGLGSGPADAVGSSEFDEPEDPEGPDGVPVDSQARATSGWLTDSRFQKLHPSVDRNQAAQLLDAVTAEFGADGPISEDNWINVGRIAVDGIAALNEMRGMTAVLVLLDALKKVGVVSKSRNAAGTQWQIIPF